MIRPDFYIGQNDTNPTLDRILYDADGNVVVLDGSAIVFNLVRLDGTKVVTRGTAVQLGTGASSQARYAWVAGDTAVAGDHYGEFEVTFPGGTVQTFPQPKKILVRITAELG